MRTVLLALALAIGIPSAAAADEPSAADRALIERAALDYIEGWYTQNAARMERALHPQLIKRRLEIARASGASSIDEMGAGRLIEATRPAPGETSAPLDDRRREVRILDQYGNAATVKIEAERWVDYLHLVKIAGEWKILNVLWELRPE